MSLDTYKKAALDAIVANPGSTRMEWFCHTFETNEARQQMWHTFKFQIALSLILGGKVKADGDRFFHISHNTQQ